MSNWSWTIQIIQMTPICWFVFIRISCHSLQRASLDKKWQKRLSTPDVFLLIGFFIKHKDNKTLDINTIYSPDLIHITSNLKKKERRDAFSFFFWMWGALNRMDFLLLSRIKLSKSENNYLCGIKSDLFFFLLINKSLWCTCAPVWVSPAVVMIAAFSQHAVRPMW